MNPRDSLKRRPLFFSVSFVAGDAAEWRHAAQRQRERVLKWWCVDRDPVLALVLSTRALQMLLLLYTPELESWLLHACLRSSDS